MNRSTLPLLAGLLAASPLLAKTVASTTRQVQEDAAWGISGKTAHAKSARKVHKAVSVRELTPNVTMTMKSNRVAARTKPPAAAAHQKIAQAEGGAPGVPVDFGTASEARAYQLDIDSDQTGIARLLSGTRGSKALKVPSGLAGANQLQAKIDNALQNGTLPQDAMDQLKTSVQKRDTDMYMLAASLVSQKKYPAAAPYLRFLARSATPGTPMRDAAAQQLAQIGF